MPRISLRYAACTARPLLSTLPRPLPWAAYPGLRSVRLCANELLFLPKNSDAPIQAAICPSIARHCLPEQHVLYLRQKKAYR